VIGNNLALFVLFGSLFVGIPLGLLLFERWRETSAFWRGVHVAAFAVTLALALAGYLLFRISDAQVAQLQQAQYGRRLTAQQMRDFEAAIGPYAGSHVSVAADGSAHDAHALAEDVFTAFDKSMWVLRGRDPAHPDVIGVMLAGGVVPEVLIGVEDTRHPTEATLAVIQAFRKIGLEPHVQNQELYPPGAITVTIGPSPVPSPQSQ